MIHHNYFSDPFEVYYSISCSQGGIGIGWERNDTDYFDLYITPGSMDWTVTLNNTGEGTSWVQLFPSSGTGEEINMFAAAFEDNPDPATRSCTVTFSDDSSEAEDLTLTITQQAAPA